MAKIPYYFCCVLLLCYGCHRRVPETNIEDRENPVVVIVPQPVGADTITYTSDTAITLPAPEVVDSVAVVVPKPTPAQPDPEPVVVVVPVAPKPNIVDVYTSFEGVREKTGKNDGPEVEAFLRAVGLGKGYAWCAAYVRKCYDLAGIKTNINGAAASVDKKDRRVFFARKVITEPEPGDAFTLWYPNLNRIGHTGFYHKRKNSTYFETYEGNTNDAGSREGDGVYHKFRSYNATYSINRWSK